MRPLLFLRQHQVFYFEVAPRMRHEFGVGRMIGALDADNGFHQLRLVLVDVLDQFGLGVGRSGDQDRVRVGD